MPDPRIKPGAALPDSSYPLPGTGRVSAEFEALRAEATKAFVDGIEVRTGNLSSKTRLNLKAAVRASPTSISVLFPNVSITTLASAGSYWLKSVVEECLLEVRKKFPQVGLRVDSVLTNDDPKMFLSGSEIKAVAAFLGRPGDALAAALERVRDLQRRNLPISLPEHVRDEDKYVHRPDGAETIVDFLRRVWGPEMEADLLTRPYLRKQDPSAYQAIKNWLRHQPLPPDIKIPTLEELNDAKVRDERSLREAMRLVSARGRRSIQP